MKYFGWTLLAIGIALPLLLIILEGSHNGVLWFLRGDNYYLVYHGNAYDFNQQLLNRDHNMVILVSAIFISSGLFIQKKSNKYLNLAVPFVALIAAFIIGAIAGWFNFGFSG